MSLIKDHMEKTSKHGDADIAVDGNARAPYPPPLLDSWFIADKKGEELFSQTTTSLTIFVGEAVLRSISKGDATWSYFMSSNFSDEQMDELSRTARDLHRHFGVIKIPEEHALVEQGEIPFDTEKIRTIYGKVKRNITSALFALSTGASGERLVYPVEEISPAVETFLTNPKNLAMATDLFSAAANAIRRPEAKRIGFQHRENFRFRKKGVPLIPSRAINDQEKAALRDSLDRILPPSLVAIGATHGLTYGQISTFMSHLEGTIAPSIHLPKV